MDEYPSITKAVKEGRMPVVQYGNELLTRKPDLDRPTLSLFALQELGKHWDFTLDQATKLATAIYRAMDGDTWGRLLPAIAFEAGRRKGVHDERARRRRAAEKAVTA